MTFSNIPSYDATTAGNNTDINGVSIAEGWPAANINNSIRNLLTQLKQYLANTATVASASSLDFGAQTGNYLLITGTTSITALGTVAAGTWKMVEFAAALTLTYNATSLILPGAVNIATAAGDTAMFVSEGSGNWRCLAYNRASGLPVVNPPAAVPPPFIAGLLPTAISGNATALAITFSAGSCTDSTGAVVITLPASSSWAVSNGNAALGYQGGTTIPNSTVIYWYAISGTAGSTIFASNSGTAPTLPTGYTYFRRIYTSLSDGSGVIPPSTVTEYAGGSYKNMLTTTVSDYSSATTTSALLVGMNVPPVAGTEAVFRVSMVGPNNAAIQTLISDPASPDETPGTANCSMQAGTSSVQGFVSGEFRMGVNSSTQVRFRANVTTGTWNIRTLGWVDQRRI